MWLYQGKEITEEEVAGYVAFVYQISNLIDRRVYFGKKLFNFTTHKRLKNRKNRIKVIKESDWKTYYGSSDELNADVAKLGEENFKREIIRLCKTRTEASYYELEVQVKNDVLFHPELYYNSYVGCRVSRKQLRIKDNG